MKTLLCKQQLAEWLGGKAIVPEIQLKSLDLLHSTVAPEILCWLLVILLSCHPLFLSPLVATEILINLGITVWLWLVHRDLHFKRQWDINTFTRVLAVSSLKRKMHTGESRGYHFLQDRLQEDFGHILKQLNLQEINCPLSLPQLLLIWETWELDFKVVHQRNVRLQTVCLFSFLLTFSQIFPFCLSLFPLLSLSHNTVLPCSPTNILFLARFLQFVD